MFVVRKLLLLATMAIAALALTASTASAQLEVHEEGPGPECGTVTLTGTHNVQGGCHIEYRSTEHIPLVAYIPNATIVTNCLWHLEAQIGETGAGYITEAELTNETIPTNPPCVRQACDEAEGAPNPHETLAWPIELSEAIPGVETLTFRFCLRPGTPHDTGNVEGPGASCTVHLEIADLGGHNYEVGHHPSEVFCEPGDFPFPVSWRNMHFTNEVAPELGTEDVEIVH